MSENEGDNTYTAKASYINSEGEEEFVRLTNEHQLACNASLMEIVLYYISFFSFQLTPGGTSELLNSLPNIG